MLPSAVVALAAIAARPPMYGGEVVNYVYQTRIEPDPALARTAADAAAHAAVYERLYDPAAAGLIPVLARERPAVDGATSSFPFAAASCCTTAHPSTPGSRRKRSPGSTGIIPGPTSSPRSVADKAVR